MRWAKPRIKSPFSGAVSYWLKATSRNWSSRRFWLAILTAKSTKDSQKSEQHFVDLHHIQTWSWCYSHMFIASKFAQKKQHRQKKTEPMYISTFGGWAGWAATSLAEYPTLVQRGLPTSVSRWYPRFFKVLKIRILCLPVGNTVFFWF